MVNKMKFIDFLQEAKEIVPVTLKNLSKYVYEAEIYVNARDIEKLTDDEYEKMVLGAEKNGTLYWGDWDRRGKLFEIRMSSDKGFKELGASVNIVMKKTKGVVYFTKDKKQLPGSATKEILAGTYK